MKKTAKKLTLDAQTIRVLNPADLQNVVGGIATTITCACDDRANSARCCSTARSLGC